MERKQASPTNEAGVRSSNSSIARRPTSEYSLSHGPPFQLLQRMHAHAGNREIGKWLQTKLTVGPPGDHYEQEADRVADHVMRMPAPGPVTISSRGNELQRSYDESEEDGGTPEPLARKQASGALPMHRTAAPGIVHEVLRSPGRPLDQATRGFFEPRFGNDFGNVRVHTDSRAAQSASAVNALAYTMGNNLVFGAGQYAPDSAHGRRLLAHELTHVQQQQGAIPLSNRGPELLQRQEGPAVPSAPAPAPPITPEAAPVPDKTQEGEKKPPETKQEQKPEEAATKDLKTRVREWLDNQKFDLPLVVDMKGSPEKWKVKYGDQLWTLERVRDEVWDVLAQVTPGIKRGDVWQHVYQYYQEKVKDADSSSWQAVVQALYTPSYTLASSQPTSGSRWANPLQLTLGANNAKHKQGFGGLEIQYALTGSFLNVGSGKADWFQNALGQIQFSAVSPLGGNFQLGSSWSYVQGSIYAQLAAGIGTNWDTPPGGQRKAYFGFLLQPGVGGQITVNIDWFQIIVQGTVVYSYFSKTKEADSHSTRTLGIQPGVGFGGSF